MSLHIPSIPTGEISEEDELSLIHISLTLEQTERRITVTGADFTYVYDTFSGAFSGIRKGEKEYLIRPMEYNIWRAPTDNDRKIRLEWERAGYDRTKVRTYTTEARLREDGSAELVTELSLSAVHIQRILNIKASWLIHRDGCIQVKLDVKKDMEFPFLPRFGPVSYTHLDVYKRQKEP